MFSILNVIINNCHHIFYWAIFLIFFLGLFTTISSSNLIKRLIGLSIMQSGVILLYISFGFILNGHLPILDSFSVRYMYYIAPLPQVLMLTAIVVGLGTFAVGLAIVIKIKNAFNTVDISEIESDK